MVNPQPSCPSRSMATTALEHVNMSILERWQASVSRRQITLTSAKKPVFHRRHLSTLKSLNTPSPTQRRTALQSVLISRVSKAPVCAPKFRTDRFGLCPVSHGLRIPQSKTRNEARFPIRQPNPYLCFCQPACGRLDGIKETKNLFRAKPWDKNLYDLPPKNWPISQPYPAPLRESLDELQSDMD